MGRTRQSQKESAHPEKKNALATRMKIETLKQDVNYCYKKQCSDPSGFGAFSCEGQPKIVTYRYARVSNQRL
jgi:hypothetical protein